MFWKNDYVQVQDVCLCVPKNPNDRGYASSLQCSTGRFMTILGEGITTLPTEIAPRKKCHPKNCKWGRLHPPPSLHPYLFKGMSIGCFRETAEI